MIDDFKITCLTSGYVVQVHVDCNIFKILYDYQIL